MEQTTVESSRARAKTRHLTEIADVDSTHGYTTGVLAAMMRELGAMPLPQRAQRVVDEALGVVDALDQVMAEAYERRGAIS